MSSPYSCPIPLAACFALALAGPAAAADHSFIIVNPAGRGNQSLASDFLNDFATALSESWPRDAGPPPSFTGNYHVHEADALASIRGRQPVFGLLSPGFFLRHEVELGLRPVLVPRLEGEADPTAHLAVIEEGPALAAIRAGSVAGLRVGGQLAGEPGWLVNVVLAGLSGGSAPVLEPISRTLSGVRALRKGKLDALVLSDAEWRLLDSVAKRGGLASAHVSGELPEGPVSTFGEGPDPALTEACARALRLFPETEAGRKVLRRMGVQSFEPAEASDYDAVRKLFHAGRETGETP